MANTYTALFTHLIFSTKLRQPVLTGEIRPRLFEYIGGIARNIKCPLLAAGGFTDHVHLLIQQHATVSTSDALRDIKANSSRWIHTTYPRLTAFHWQDGGGAFSVSASGLDDLKAYIANQEEHHRAVSFQEEYLKFLKKYGVEYDLKYVFD